MFYHAGMRHGTPQSRLKAFQHPGARYLSARNIRETEIVRETELDRALYARQA
jgi:hypothetical protein